MRDGLALSAPEKGASQRVQRLAIAAALGFVVVLAWGVDAVSAQATEPGRLTSAPYPPPRPFDLAPPQAPLFIRTPPTAASPSPEPSPVPAPVPSSTAETGAAPASDAPGRLVADAPLPPLRTTAAPAQTANAEEEEDEAPPPPAGTWPRRTPGQADLLFEPRPTPEDAIRANGITTDPGTSVSCLPAPLKRVLTALVERYGGVRVTSTFRPAWRARRHSFHRRCEAVDFRVPGETPRNVLEFVKTLPETGGHKVYWNGLVHVDVGPWRSW